MTTPNYARKVYQSVVEDVISNVREAFLDEGVDEQVLQELRQLWESKLAASRALEPEQPDPVVPSGNIPYQVMQPQQPSQTRVVQQSSAVHAPIPVPVQISADQITNAAGMAFSAQGGMFPQALVNVNPGAQITLQQTVNGQYILQALPPGVSQQQMVSVPQQQIMQNQSQIQVQAQNIPQLDGAVDEATATASTSQTHTGHQCQSTVPPKGGARSKNRRKASKKLIDLLNSKLPQVDGNHDTSSSDDDNYDDDDDDNEDDDREDGEDGEGEEEEPLNSDDDVSEEDPQELFDTDNVVVCQFEKISRNKNKWKFNLKDGIMSLDGKDHVFQKGLGEADW